MKNIEMEYKISSVVVNLHSCQPHTIFSEFLSCDLICDNSCEVVETLLVLAFGSLGMVSCETF